MLSLFLFFLCSLWLGAQKPTISAILSVVTYWLLALPAICLLIFVLKIGLQGIWIGVALPQVLLGVALLVVVARIDWVQLANETVQRIAQQERKDNESALDGDVESAISLEVPNGDTEMQRLVLADDDVVADDDPSGDIRQVP